MSDEFKLWKMEQPAVEIRPRRFPLEKDLKNFVMNNPQVIEAGLLPISAEYELDTEDKADILAMTIDGWLVPMEFKRGDINKRKIVGQILDYGAEVGALKTEEIKEEYEDNHGRPFEEGYRKEFGVEPPEELNRNHSMIVAGTGIEEVERILTYLYERHGVPINGLTFDYFEDGGNEYVVNTWFNDPYEVWESLSEYRSWPESHYLNLKGERRSWSDWSEYGFVQAGGGDRFKSHMEKLKEGQLVYAYRPHGQGPSRGYLGVGRVNQEAKPVTEFEVAEDGQQVPILDADYEAEALSDNSNDPETCEYFVGVDWLAKRDDDNALFDGNMFYYMETRCKLKYTKSHHRRTIRKIHSEFEFESK